MTIYDGPPAIAAESVHYQGSQSPEMSATQHETLKNIPDTVVVTGFLAVFTSKDPKTIFGS
jgi:hypothetical protein